MWASDLPHPNRDLLATRPSTSFMVSSLPASQRMNCTQSRGGPDEVAWRIREYGQRTGGSSSERRESLTPSVLARDVSNDINRCAVFTDPVAANRIAPESR